MVVYVDDVKVELDGQTVGQMLEAAQERLEPSGRVIVEVKVDGDSLVGDAIVHHQDEAADNREIHLYTAEPRELCIETLGHVREQLDVMRTMHAEAAENLQQDKPAEALKKLSRIIQYWLHVQEAVLHSTRLMNIDIDSLQINDKTMIQTVEGLRDQLESVKTMLTSGDTVGLADAMAYEWPDMIDHWDQLIGILCLRIGGADV